MAQWQANVGLVEMVDLERFTSQNPFRLKTRVKQLQKNRIDIPYDLFVIID